MKRMLLLAIIFSSIQAKAQHNKLNKMVDDDGKVLILKVDAVQDGREIKYKNRFNVEGLQPRQRDSIVNHVMDSLGIREGRRRKLLF
jgi:hypothetical protein